MLQQNIKITLRWKKWSASLYLCFKCLFLRERERERQTDTEHKWGRGREREGDAESEIGCKLWAVNTEPDAGLEPTNREIMTLNQLSHPSAPMFIYFWERDRQSMSGGGAEKEGDAESEAGSRLWAVITEPEAGLKLSNHEIMWPEPKSGA